MPLDVKIMLESKIKRFNQTFFLINFSLKSRKKYLKVKCHRERAFKKVTKKGHALFE